MFHPWILNTTAEEFDGHKNLLISGKIQICPPAYWRKLESYSDWNMDPSDVWIDAWFFFMHRLAFFSFQIGTYPYLIYENPESNFRYLEQFHLNFHCFGLIFDDENDIRTPDHRQVLRKLYTRPAFKRSLFCFQAFRLSTIKRRMTMTIQFSYGKYSKSDEKTMCFFLVHSVFMLSGKPTSYVFGNPCENFRWVNIIQINKKCV